MKQSDPLELVEKGSLERPGPIGRLVRLILGAACLYALYELVIDRQSIIQTPVSVLPNVAIIALATILIINYVVNIGFGRSWGRWPSYVCVISVASFAALSWLLFGTVDHALLGTVLWAWMVYFFGHLGSSFVVAAIIATPGCEMRAIPELLGRVCGHPAEEHRCPAALITRIDAWESRRTQDSTTSPKRF